MRYWVFSFIAVLLFSVRETVIADTSDSLQLLELPYGFDIAVFASGVPNARSLTRSKANNDGATIVYISTDVIGGPVYAAVDISGNGTADYVLTLLNGLHEPNGVAWHDGSLFVMLVDRVMRYDNVDEVVLAAVAGDPILMEDPVSITSAFPSDEWHGLKRIIIGPDSKMYIPQGMPCNKCDRMQNGDIWYGSINRMNLNGSEIETYAVGLRNSVGMDFSPVTGLLYFTDNGQDDLGSLDPDDEFNVITSPGQDFGFPYCHAKGNATGSVLPRQPGGGEAEGDPQYGVGKECNDPSVNTQPVQLMGPHAASLGMRFYNGDMFPAEYNNSIFVALHGSHPNGDEGIYTGYAVTNVKLADDGLTSVDYELFISGFLQEGNNIIGRPVDILQLEDGSLLISDDQAGLVYRVTYSDESADML